MLEDVAKMNLIIVTTKKEVEKFDEIIFWMKCLICFFYSVF